jgi:predicted enzyme related to lactoylglutathione lyase
MAQPVVHFEIIGKEPAKLRSYFGELFGWEFDTSSPVATAVSEPDDYGFVNHDTTTDGTGIPAASAAARRTRPTRCSTSAWPTSRPPCSGRSAWAARA